MIKVLQGQNGQYDVRLSSSVRNIILVGAVNIARESRALRIIAGVLGSALLLGGALSPLIRLRIDAFSAISSPGPMILGLALLLPVVLASKSFNLLFAEEPEVEERREAEEEIGESQNPFAWLELDAKRLSEYYAINQAQARGSFRWAVFAMFCGLATIVSGVWLFYLRPGSQDAFLTSLSTAAGVVINVVSGLYLYLHNNTQRRSLYYYGQLVRVQQLGLVIRLAESHDKAEDRSEARNRVIAEILSIARLSAEHDLESAAEEAA
jgi:hypothetical protein